MGFFSDHRISFLSKFGYSTLGFGLLGASTASQVGFLAMQAIGLLRAFLLLFYY